jgi:hypothetical protein
MRVDYFNPLNKKFSEWVSMPDIQACFDGDHKELFLAKKLAEYLMARGLPEDRADTINDVADLILSAYEFKQPTEIMITKDPKNPKYNRIVPLTFGEVSIEVHTEPVKLANDSSFWG